MTAWVVDMGGGDMWNFWIWAARCDECNAYLKEAKPVMGETGVKAVAGKCFRHGEVETHSFELGDLIG
jgi:hypothetical protein